MKFTLIALAILSAKAMACPDISGTYKSIEQRVPVKYVQQGCETLTRYIGEIDENGAITFPATGMFFVMDGKPNCTIRNFCTTVTPTADSLKVELNFEGAVVTKEHGSCSQKSFELSLDSDGNLAADYQVTNCEDKFAGSVRKISQKL